MRLQAKTRAVHTFTGAKKNWISVGKQLQHH
jgi:hypothetical protein